jgi:heme-degrading monooxygenase HmoA
LGYVTVEDRSEMSVLKRHRVPGMSKDTYDEVATSVEGSLASAPGFVAHHAVIDDGVLTVFEIWDSTTEHDKWFGENVKPQLPEGTPNPETFEIIRTMTQ